MGTLTNLLGESEGQFVHIVGGPDVGKSHMMRDLVSTLPAKGRRVFLLNGRLSGAEHAVGLLYSIKHDSAFAAELQGAVTLRFGLAAKLTNVSFGALLESIVAVCKRKGEFSVLIIDHADLALRSGTGPEAASALETLHLLTSLTNVQKRMGALLVASEYSEPFRLQDLGFRTSNMTETVVASELPPADMRQLLVERWGCGPLRASSASMAGSCGARTLRIRDSRASRRASGPVTPFRRC